MTGEISLETQLRELTAQVEYLKGRNMILSQAVTNLSAELAKIMPPADPEPVAEAHVEAPRPVAKDGKARPGRSRPAPA